MKRLGGIGILAVAAGIFLMAGCTKRDSSISSAAMPVIEKEAAEPANETWPEKAGKSREHEPVTILVAAAASLQASFDDDLIPMFQEAYPHITVEATYDSSGKLQTQIEEGMEADLFMSAAMKQMEALAEEGMIDKDSVTELLENKIVLIVHGDSQGQMASFSDIVHADTVALGDPQSVPAGQYAKEALMNLGIWEQVEQKASFGTNVTEVLHWVMEGSADAGIVYATDAAATDQVKVVSEAPEGSLAKKVVYPVGLVNASKHKEAASLFLAFLQSDEAMAVFKAYGFSQNVTDNGS